CRDKPFSYICRVIREFGIRYILKKEVTKLQKRGTALLESPVILLMPLYDFFMQKNFSEKRRLDFY
ncbi:hypothetical protein, partial [Bacteroides heparinolyticus]|uniref:hypothetical protein n=1 Tax=Prevotella heparinolytica TaxID=28113 RepID=UPI00359F8591